MNGVVSLREGGNATLQCRARGQPAPKIAWIRIRTGYREEMKPVSANLEFKNIGKLHADNYECVATNIYGKKSLSVFLDVQCKYINVDDRF